MTRTVKYSIGALCAFGLSLANAALILKYDFATDLNPSTVDANASGSAITWTYGTAGRSAAENLFVRSSSTPAAVDTNLYFQFILTPDVGYELDLTSLTFDYFTETTLATFTTQMVLRSSVDGYTNNIASTPNPVSITATSTSGLVTDFASFDLSGPSYQNLSTAPTFRIYNFDNANGATVTRLDNITVNGAVSVIPEPGALALLLVGLGSAVLLRRNKS